MIPTLNGPDHRLIMLFRYGMLGIRLSLQNHFLSFMISCLSFFGTTILILRILVIHTMYCETPLGIF